MAREQDTMGTQGVDWEWRTAKGSNVKTRHRFTAAERAAMAPKPAAKPKASTTTSTKSAPAAKVYSGRGDAPYKEKGPNSRMAPAPAKKPNAPKAERPISPTRSKTATGRYSAYETARLGNITEAQFDKLTPAQREAKGLPVSWMDYVRSGGDSTVRKVRSKAVSAGPDFGNAMGFRKGGMVTKKGKC